MPLPLWCVAYLLPSNDQSPHQNSYTHAYLRLFCASYPLQSPNREEVPDWSLALKHESGQKSRKTFFTLQINERIYIKNKWKQNSDQLLKHKTLKFREKKRELTQWCCASQQAPNSLNTTDDTFWLEFQEKINNEKLLHFRTKEKSRIVFYLYYECRLIEIKR